MNNNDISDRIDFLRFFMIIGLVLLHYSEFEGAEKLWPNTIPVDTHPYSALITAFVENFFKCSVPILSVISGYLFFNGSQPDREFHLKKYRNRAKTVLLPMMSWGFICMGILLVISWISPHSRLLTLTPYDVSKIKFLDLENAIFGGTRLPIIMQFWFLHDLLLTVLFSPILTFFLRRAPWAAGAVVFLIWMGNFEIPLFFRTDVLFFFYVGALVRTKNVPLDAITPRVSCLLMVLLVVLTLVQTGLPHFMPAGHWTNRILGASTRGLRLLSVFAFWGFAPFLVNTWLGRQILKVSGLAFFLHAIHWPMNQFFKFGLADLVPSTSDVAMLSIYFASAFLTIATALIVAYVLATLSPGLLSHLSGGRSINRRARAAGPDYHPPQKSGGAMARDALRQSSNQSGLSNGAGHAQDPASIGYSIDGRGG